ncbi:hypothetical protein LCGC14_1801020 [marine sediment metagenome]|uniref:ABC transmembrane type-2 domain-containing protein n=1 Tax=marine sediment metagenome TaxID=412755 RepID=A0A0F9GPI0_9ZZZZ|nr:ABC transporter [Actinomycetota bacterium]
MNIAHNAKGVYTIWLRELKRFWRDRTRMFGSIAQPTLFLFILGTGLGYTFKRGGIDFGGNDFNQFIFPGIVAMSLLFTSTFSAMSIIWDREFGFLKEVLVAPISRMSVAIGKALGGSTVAMIQGTILLLFAPLVGVKIGILMLPLIWASMFLIAFSLTSFAIIFGISIRSTEGFQMIMNFMLMPMFLLSGALYKLDNLGGWIEVIVRINPLTYGVDLLRGLMLNDTIYGLTTDIAFLSIFGAVSLVIAVFAFKRSD